MSPEGRSAAGRQVSAAVITEAAAWVARLHGPLRSATVERGFRNWLQEHADHRRALELVTDSWEEVAQLRSGATIEVSVPSDKPEPIRGRLPLAIAAGLALIAVGAVMIHLRMAGVSTGVGEQRILALEDGTRVSLNTSTRVRVQFNEQQRSISLDSGEAFFEVAKHSAWPFVVSAGGQSVTALGTAFVVRRDARKLTVTLMDGKVAVSPTASSGGAASAPTEESAILQPGERATFVDDQRLPRVDHPAVENVIAWQRGKVPIDNLTLAEAVLEMNRYSTVPLVIERDEARELRVSGIFRAGDSLSFARAVSQNYGLEVRQQGTRIVLGGLGR